MADRFLSDRDWLRAILYGEMAGRPESEMRVVADAIANRAAAPDNYAYGTPRRGTSDTFEGQIHAYSGPNPQFSAIDEAASRRESSAGIPYAYYNFVAARDNPDSVANNPSFQAAQRVADAFANPASMDYQRYRGIARGADYYDVFQPGTTWASKQPWAVNTFDIGPQHLYSRNPLLPEWTDPGVRSDVERPYPPERPSDQDLAAYQSMMRGEVLPPPRPTEAEFEAYRASQAAQPFDLWGAITGFPSSLAGGLQGGLDSFFGGLGSGIQSVGNYLGNALSPNLGIAPPDLPGPLYGLGLGRIPEGLRPLTNLPGFNAESYLSQNPDVAAAVSRGETSALQHYLDHGIAEGRAGSGVDPMTAATYAAVPAPMSMYTRFPEAATPLGNANPFGLWDGTSALTGGSSIASADGNPLSAWTRFPEAATALTGAADPLTPYTRFPEAATALTGQAADTPFTRFPEGAAPLTGSLDPSPWGGLRAPEYLLEGGIPPTATTRYIPNDNQNWMPSQFGGSMRSDANPELVGFTGFGTPDRNPLSESFNPLSPNSLTPAFNANELNGGGPNYDPVNFGGLLAQPDLSAFSSPDGSGRIPERNTPLSITVPGPPDVAAPTTSDFLSAPGPYDFARGFSAGAMPGAETGSLRTPLTAFSPDITAPSLPDIAQPNRSDFLNPIGDPYSFSSLNLGGGENGSLRTPLSSPTPDFNVPGVPDVPALARSDFLPSIGGAYDFSQINPSGDVGLGTLRTPLSPSDSLVPAIGANDFATGGLNPDVAGLFSRSLLGSANAFAGGDPTIVAPNLPDVGLPNRADFLSPLGAYDFSTASMGGTAPTSFAQAYPLTAFQAAPGPNDFAAGYDVSGGLGAQPTSFAGFTPLASPAAPAMPALSPWGLYGFGGSEAPGFGAYADPSAPALGPMAFAGAFDPGGLFSASPASFGSAYPVASAPAAPAISPWGFSSIFPGSVAEPGGFGDYGASPIGSPAPAYSPSYGLGPNDVGGFPGYSTPAPAAPAMSPWGFGLGSVGDFSVPAPAVSPSVGPLEFSMAGEGGPYSGVAATPEGGSLGFSGSVGDSGSSLGIRLVNEMNQYQNNVQAQNNAAIASQNALAAAQIQNALYSPSLAANANSAWNISPVTQQAAQIGPRTYAESFWP